MIGEFFLHRTRVAHIYHNSDGGPALSNRTAAFPGSNALERIAAWAMQALVVVVAQMRVSTIGTQVIREGSRVNRKEVQPRFSAFADIVSAV